MLQLPWHIIMASRSVATTATATSTSAAACGPYRDNPLITAVTTVARGEAPSNAVLADSLERTKDALEEQKRMAPLNERGQRLVDDTRDIIDSTERLLLEKNRDEKFQRLFYHTKEAGRSLGDNRTLGSFTTSPELKETLQQARELAMFLVTSSEFRAILMDAIKLFQNILSSTRERLRDDTYTQGSTMDTAQRVVQDIQYDVYSGRVLPDEQRRAFAERFRILLQRLAAKPEFRKAIKNMFSLADQWRSTFYERQTGIDYTRFNLVKQDVQEIIEEFTGKGSLDLLFKHLNKLYKELIYDEYAQAFFKDARYFIIESLKYPETLGREDRIYQSQELVRRGREILLSERYKYQFTKIFEITKVLLENVKRDPIASELTSKIYKFGQDMIMNEEGKPDMGVLAQSVEQLKYILVPVLRKQLEYVPVPRITGSDPRYDFSVENLVFYGGELIPDAIDVQMNNELKMNVRRLAADKTRSSIILKIKDMKTRCTDVKFWYRRKTFPRIEDYGLVDIDMLGGRGISIKIVWKLHALGNEPMTVKLQEVKCVIDQLDIRVREAKHNILDRLGLMLFSKRIKQQVASSIVKNVVERLEPINMKINSWLAQRPLTTLTSKATFSLKNAPVKLLKKAKEVKKEEKKYQEPGIMQDMRYWECDYERPYAWYEPYRYGALPPYAAPQYGYQYQYEGRPQAEEEIPTTVRFIPEKMWDLSSREAKEGYEWYRPEDYDRPRYVEREQYREPHRESHRESYREPYRERERERESEAEWRRREREAYDEYQSTILESTTSTTAEALETPEGDIMYSETEVKKEKVQIPGGQEPIFEQPMQRKVM